MADMKFHAVYTTEEYLEAHPQLVPRKFIYNNSSKYVFGHNEFKNAY